MKVNFPSFIKPIYSYSPKLFSARPFSNKKIDGKIKHIILTPGLSGVLSSRNPNKIIKKPYEIISSKL